MVVVAARRDEERAGVAADGDVEAERARPEALGGGEVGDLEVDVAERRACGHPQVGLVIAHLGKEALQVERQGVHLEVAAGDRPLCPGTVAVELDPVVLRVGEVERLADEVVGGAGEPPARTDDAAQRTGEVGPFGH